MGAAPSNGHGSYTFPDGETYDGKWKNSKPHGRGKAEYPNGDIYEGHWMYGQKCGPGVFRYANGDVYEGYWSGDKKWGTGILRYANGRKYDGSFKNDKYEGRGVFTYTVSGNVPDEYGGCSLDAKDKINGVFKAGKRHGPCTYTFFNGETFRCFFLEGRCAEFDERQAAVRAAPDAASVHARAYADAKKAKYARTIAILQRLELHDHIPAFMSVPAATHLPPVVVTQVAGKRTSRTRCCPP
jgi:hypothetical protein